MNDELQKALAAIINKTIGAMDAGAGFLQAELPEVIRQLLLWKAVQSGIQFLISAALFVAFVIIAIKFAKSALAYEPRNDYDENALRPIMSGFSVLAACLMIFIITCNLDWVQIMIAPKVYLVEYAAHLANK